MKYGLIILVIVLAGVACQQKAIKVEPTKQVLEQKKVDVSSIYKKRSGDLVEALYEELIRGSAELTDLELAIKEIKKEGVDSLKDYKVFLQKNNAFYDFADKKVTSISDSILRLKLQKLIGQSRRQFADSTGRHAVLDSLIAKRTASISDLHTVLKLVKTLPLIEDFQRSNLPPVTPAENALRHLDSLAMKVDSLVRADSVAIKSKLPALPPASGPTR